MIKRIELVESLVNYDYYQRSRLYSIISADTEILMNANSSVKNKPYCEYIRNVHFLEEVQRVTRFCATYGKTNMTFYRDERPNWIKPNDPFFAMYPNNCVNRTVWLLRTVPTKTPTKEGKPISVLEYFLSMDEESFWLVIDRCPDCTSYLLFDAYYRHFHRRDRQLFNLLKQEDYLEIDLLFKPSLELQPRVSGKRKLLRGRCIEGCPFEIRPRFKRTKFISLKNKIRTKFYTFNY
ncbi:hypothetical protein KQX54_002316 [Cotesia glomerata]|uniref:Uncharacterized protein n=1 Tax=Cotesia glomerata TaxID=32391 RepID=A0AAV7I2W8_COTGL|nr:hypothetical protein KQX54_002187 [Cotesia glomerata]KAH0545679.1 hypothetical protein KQX54_002316 [Cotesia glomerata]